METPLNYKLVEKDSGFIDSSWSDVTGNVKVDDLVTEANTVNASKASNKATVLKRIDSDLNKLGYNLKQEKGGQLYAKKKILGQIVDFAQSDTGQAIIKGGSDIFNSVKNTNTSTNNQGTTTNNSGQQPPKEKLILGMHPITAVIVGISAIGLTIGIAYLVTHNKK